MRIKIADISFDLDDLKKRNKNFKTFFDVNSDLNSDVKLKIVNKFSPMLNSKKLLFKAHDFWSIYRDRKNYVVFDYFNSDGALFSRVGVFNRHYTKGEIYIKNKKFFDKSFSTKVFLSYPMGPVLMSNLLARNEGMFIHASGVKKRYDGKAFLFCGTSGVGKSTISEIWKRTKKGIILNDDRIIVRKVNSKFYAYGCPWHTVPELISNQQAEIDKIFFITHGKNNTISKLKKNLANLRLLRNVYLPVWDKTRIKLSLKFLDNMVKNVECFDLKFVPNQSIIKKVNAI